MAIKDWSENERPREKLLTKGAVALSDAELLAILLRTGTKGLDAVALARRLIQDLGSLRGVFSVSLSQLQQHKGLGVSAYTQFAAVREIGKRLLCEEMQHLPSVQDSAALGEYLRLAIGQERIEIMLALLLDNQQRIVSIEELSRGTVAEHTVYIREVAKLAIDKHAAALIIAHNHPTGSLQASDEDRIFTVRLNAALKLFDIQLLDHLIVTATKTLSFAEQGWL